MRLRALRVYWCMYFSFSPIYMLLVILILFSFSSMYMLFFYLNPTLYAFYCALQIFYLNANATLLIKLAAMRPYMASGLL